MFLAASPCSTIFLSIAYHARTRRGFRFTLSQAVLFWLLLLLLLLLLLWLLLVVLLLPLTLPVVAMVMVMVVVVVMRSRRQLRCNEGQRHATLWGTTVRGHTGTWWCVGARLTHCGLLRKCTCCCVFGAAGV